MRPESHQGPLPFEKKGGEEPEPDVARRKSLWIQVIAGAGQADAPDGRAQDEPRCKSAASHATAAHQQEADQHGDPEFPCDRGDVALLRGRVIARVQGQ